MLSLRLRLLSFRFGLLCFDCCLLWLGFGLGLLEQSELDAIHDIVQADFRKFVAHPPSKRNPTDDSVIRALPLFSIDNAEEVYAKYR